MRVIIIIVLGLFGVANAQYSPTSAKSRFVNGIALGTKLDSYFAAADSNAIYWRADSVVMAKYKGTARALAFAVSGGYKPISDTFFTAGYTTRARTKQQIDSLSNAVSNGFVTIGTTQDVTGQKSFTQGKIFFASSGGGQSVGGSGSGIHFGNTNTLGGTNNIVIGFEALGNGDKGISIGSEARSGSSGASSNISIGQKAGVSLTTGTGNILMGSSAGRYAGTFPSLLNFSTPTNSILIGGETRGSTISDDNTIVIGYNLTGNGSNTVTIGNSSVTGNYFNGFLKQTSVTSSLLKASSTGVLEAAVAGTDYVAPSALSGYVQGSGTTNYIPKFTSGSAIGNSTIFDNGSIGINTTTPDIIGYGTANVFGILGASGNPANIQMGIVGTAAATTTPLGDINFYGLNGGASVVGRTLIRGSLDGATNSTKFDFWTMSAGTLAPRFTVSSSALTSTVPINGTSAAFSGSATVSGNLITNDIVMRSATSLGFYNASSTLLASFSHTTGALTLNYPLNGTSASFSGAVSAAGITNNSGNIRTTFGSDNSYYSLFSNDGALTLDTYGVGGFYNFKVLGSTKISLTNSGRVLFAGSGSLPADNGTDALQVAGSGRFNGAVSSNNQSGSAGQILIVGTQASAKNYELTNVIAGISNTGFSIRNTTDARNELSFDGTGAATFSSSVTVTGNLFSGGTSMASISNPRALIIQNPAGTDFVLGIKGGTTTGSSYGPFIQAGTNSSDISLLVRDVNNVTDYFKIKGNGVSSFSENLLLKTTTDNGTDALQVAGSALINSGSGAVSTTITNNGDFISNWVGNSTVQLFSIRNNSTTGVHLNTQNSAPLRLGVSTGTGGGTVVNHLEILSTGATILSSTANSDWGLTVGNSGTTGANGLYVNIGSGATGVPFRVDKGGSALFTVANTGAATFSNLAGTGDRLVQANSSGQLSATQAIASGTYTPTLTNTTNITSSTLTHASYTRVGNIVTVFVRASASITANGVAELTFSLPISTTTPNATLTGSNINSTPLIEAVVSGGTSGTTIGAKFIGVAGDSHTISVTFQYTVN